MFLIWTTIVDGSVLKLILYGPRIRINYSYPGHIEVFIFGNIGNLTFYSFSYPANIGNLSFSIFYYPGNIGN